MSGSNGPRAGASRRPPVPPFWRAFLGIGLGVLLLLVASGELQARSFGLILGVADYPSPINDLRYTDDDALAIWDALVSDPGFQESDLVLLLDSAASKPNVEAAIRAIADRAAAGDTVFIYFAGHGTVGPDLVPIDEADELDEYLCTYGNTLEDFLRDDELEELIRLLGALDVTVVIDACYSGGGLGSVRSLNAGPAPREGDGLFEDLDRVHHRDASPQDLIDLEGSLVALAACAEGELSWELGPPDNHGLFTLFLLEGLEGAADLTGNENSWISAEEIYFYAEPRAVQQSDVWGLNQHPQILDAYEGELELVLSPADAPTASFTVLPSSGTAPLAVMFDPTQSTAKDGHEIVTFEWRFGDGESRVQSDSGIVQHVFATAHESETFDVYLVATDERGLSGEATRSVVVTNCPPMAGFEWRASLANEEAPWTSSDLDLSVDGTTVEIEVRSLAPIWDDDRELPYPCGRIPTNLENGGLSYDPEGHGAPGDGWGIRTFEIDFGDGSGLAAPASLEDGGLAPISHTYDYLAEGVSSFTVTLTVLDELGASASLSRVLYIHSPEEDCAEVAQSISADGWCMITLPGTLCGDCGEGYGNLVCALCDDLDPCFAFHYDPGANGYVMVPPAEALDYMEGMGLWVRAAQVTQLCSPVTVPTESVAIGLGAGWNQIGNPFDFAVSASSVTVVYQGQEVSLEQAHANGWVSMYLFGYDPVAGGYTMVFPPSGVLDAYAGYWILANVNCDVRIPSIPAPLAPPSSAQRVNLQQLKLQGVPTPPAPPTIPTDQSPEEILDGLSVGNRPNPVRSEHTTTFGVWGPSSMLIDAIRVEVYDQRGQLVWSEEAVGTETQWHTKNDAGELLANGIYLYQIWVQVGDAWLPTGILKVAVVR